MIKIEKNIPIRQGRWSDRQKYPILELEIGDSFFSPARIHLGQYNKRLAPKHFSTSKWTENGVHGYRIWRTK